MPTRKDLSLEDKLKLPVRKLPFSKEVKTDLLNKSVYSLKEIYDKFLKIGDIEGDPLPYLPGFKKETYLECGYLLVAIGLLPTVHEKDNRFANKRIDSYVNQEV